MYNVWNLLCFYTVADIYTIYQVSSPWKRNLLKRKEIWREWSKFYYTQILKYEFRKLLKLTCSLECKINSIWTAKCELAIAAWISSRNAELYAHFRTLGFSTALLRVISVSQIIKHDTESSPHSHTHVFNVLFELRTVYDGSRSMRVTLKRKGLIQV